MNEKNVAAPSAARLHVLLARDVPFAVILRRGPSKQVCTIGWNLNDDTFQVGQWFKGRIYEWVCDISPDGRHLLYHAYKPPRLDSTVWEYTVLSRAPYLKAIKIWKNTRSYESAFLNNERFALLGNAPQPKVFRVAPFGEVKNEAELAQIERPADILQWKFERDGWKGWNKLAGSNNLEWIKSFAGWELKMTRSISSSTYIVRGRRLEKTFDCARWNWADFRGKRLLWAQDGKIFAAKVWEGGHGPVEELADFNDWTFEPIVAPY
ncbi:MAG TPA: hypothetical protein VF627_00780 [Abditibacterium sp.]|jgi:hypothetical protein